MCRHAAEQGYTFAGPITVHLTPGHSPDIGRYRIASRITPAQHHRKQGNSPRIQD
ncbi:hypothetical protein P8605_28065 [Streptomyces sp. T-3]|nr:hypothetical protein [Streptomyces sp. T-3]